MLTRESLNPVQAKRFWFMKENWKKSQVLVDPTWSKRVELALSSGAGSSPGHDNLWKPFGECAAPVKLCMIDDTKTGKVSKF